MKNIIKLEDLDNKKLARFVRIVKETEVRLLQKFKVKKKEYTLYEIGKILVLDDGDQIISEWDEEFDYFYFNYIKPKT
jgi:hypothetical protein